MRCKRLLVLLVLSVFLWSSEVLAGNITYTYDNAGRLIKADYGGGKSITYEYDNAGNLLKKTSTASTSIFADVDPSSVFYDYIVAIYNRQITIGCGQNPLRYCPSVDVDRGQMAAFIIRAKFGENFTFTQTPYFTDVPAGHKYFKYVQKMKDESITVVEGIYGVLNGVTRGQMAAFIIRAKFGEDFTFTQTPYFTDVPAGHTYFKYVQKMKDVGYTKITGNLYNVDQIVPREQMAAFIARAFLDMQ